MFISQVPILDRTSLPHLQPNTLVRYRGMIQDMLGNEFYVGVYKDGGGTWTTNKFTDVSNLPFETLSENTRIWERRLLYCVPVSSPTIIFLPLLAIFLYFVYKLLSICFLPFF